jgi:hypothetical protein
MVRENDGGCARNHVEVLCTDEYGRLPQKAIRDHVMEALRELILRKVRPCLPCVFEMMTKTLQGPRRRIVDNLFDARANPHNVGHVNVREKARDRIHKWFWPTGLFESHGCQQA